MKSIRVFLLFCFFSKALTAQIGRDSFLVKPYLQFATQESMYVLWETTSPATTTVEYGEALLKANEPNLSMVRQLPGTRSLHEVKLDQLKTGTKYLYRVKSRTENGEELVSAIYTFGTAVEKDRAYMFALIGDTQFNDRTPWAWGTIAQKVWEDRPHFIIHAGDLVDQGLKKSDWTSHFFPNGHVAMSRFPMYTVLGNHEQDAPFYYDYMVNPEPEYRYTFTYGNAQFFMIDTNRDVFEGSEQYNWLEWELAKSTATWKFAVHHHPPYSSEENDHGDSYIGASSYGTHARNLVPLYETYGVDFCLFGHTHLYERTWPLFEDAVNLQNGVVYINSGGAGGGLEDFDPVRSWFTQELQTGHHYCTFAIYDKTLVFKAIDHEGRLFDTFQMTKESDGENESGMNQPPAPQFEIAKQIFQDKSRVVLKSLQPDFRIYYTLDGSEPNLQSASYQTPLEIDQSCTLRARVYTPDGRASRVVERSFTKMQPRPASKPKSVNPGLLYQYFEGNWDFLPDFRNLKAVSSGMVPMASLKGIPHREDQFAVVLEGYVEFPETDSYTLYLRSDDGSSLFIDGEKVVDSDGNHAVRWEYGSTILEKGMHKIRIEYFESSGYQMLEAGWVDKEGFNVPFAADKLRH